MGSVLVGIWTAFHVGGLYVAGSLVARDAQRQSGLDEYAGTRRYILADDQMHKRAEMIVHLNGRADGTKHFEIVAKSSWNTAQKHVSQKMLESEAETLQPQGHTKTRLSCLPQLIVSLVEALKRKSNDLLGAAR